MRDEYGKLSSTSLFHRSHAGRNVCGTLGVGYYKQYRYGIRWFGDFRGAVPGVAHTFCIDLGFWYPSAKYRYEAQPASTLRSRNGRPVSSEDRAKMTYAAWTFGRSTDADQQAAVMLYVHSLMHDARPGETPGARRGVRAPRFPA